MRNISFSRMVRELLIWCPRQIRDLNRYYFDTTTGTGIKEVRLPEIPFTVTEVPLTVML